MTEYSRHQFAAFRFLVGVGAFLYFIFLPPYAPELTEARSLGIPLRMLGAESPFASIDTMGEVRVMLLALAILSALFAIGVARRFIAPVLLLAFVASTATIPLIPGPHDGYLPFLLLIALLVPHGEAMTAYPIRPRWDAPHELLGAARFVFPAGLVIFALLQAFVFASPDWILVFCYLALGLLAFPRSTRAAAGLASILLMLALPASPLLALALTAAAAAVFALDPGASFPWQRADARFDIFIDGECVLCNGFAELVLDEDKRRRFRIASLQGTHARASLPERLRGEKVFTVVLKDGDKIYEKSTAALLVLGGLGGIWNFAYALLLIPAFVRNFFYSLVARHRYRIFGKFNECRLPTPSERGRVLD